MVAQCLDECHPTTALRCAAITLAPHPELPMTSRHFVRFHVHRDPDERDLLIALTERAQAKRGGPVRSQEILDEATPHERAQLPDSSRGICRALERHVQQSDVFGRTIRRCRRNGSALWGVYIAEDAISWASEEKLREHLRLIQDELARRAAERAALPAPTPNPFAGEQH